MSLKSLDFTGSVEVSGVRAFGSGEHRYNVMDLYVPGQGGAVLFLRSGKTSDDVVSLKLGVFASKGQVSRLVVVPVYKQVGSI